MILVPRQTNKDELLDLHCGNIGQVRTSLHDLRRINRWLGGTRIMVESTLGLMEQRDLTKATLLDVGTGAADVPLSLVAAARRRGIELRVVALDISARHLQVAREDTLNECNVRLLQGDSFHLPLPDQSVDFVTASLFLHHFRAQQIAALLQEFSRVCRHAWSLSDLVRHSIPLSFFLLTRPIFARSYLTRHDGEASLRRCYTIAEMLRILGEAGFHDVCVKSHFPYRMLLTWERSGHGFV